MGTLLMVASQPLAIKISLINILPLSRASKDAFASCMHLVIFC